MKDILNETAKTNLPLLCEMYEEETGCVAPWSSRTGKHDVEEIVRVLSDKITVEDLQKELGRNH